MSWAFPGFQGSARNLISMVRGPLTNRRPVIDRMCAFLKAGAGLTPRDAVGVGVGYPGRPVYQSHSRMSHSPNTPALA